MSHSNRRAMRVSELDLCGWVGAAVRGDRLVYYRGHLVIDIDSASSRLPDRERKELMLVARRARWAFREGLVHFFQRRHGRHDYGYEMVARGQPAVERRVFVVNLANIAELVEAQS
jgi:hypothetical protein